MAKSRRSIIKRITGKFLSSGSSSTITEKTSSSNKLEMFDDSPGAQSRAASPGNPSTSPGHNRGRPPGVVVELGYTGLRSFQGSVQEEFLTQLQGYRGVQVYTEMASNDAVIGGIIQMMLQTMRGVSWAIETDGTSNQEQCYF